MKAFPVLAPSDVAGVRPIGKQQLHHLHLRFSKPLEAWFKGKGFRLAALYKIRCDTTYAPYAFRLMYICRHHPRPLGAKQCQACRTPDAQDSYSHDRWTTNLFLRFTISHRMTCKRRFNGEHYCGFAWLIKLLMRY